MKFRKSILGSALTAGSIALILGAAVNADWSADNLPPISMFEAQDIVITYKLNPRKETEAACLAITLARSLRGDFTGPNANNVTLFVTLEGVVLGREWVVNNIDERCLTPEGKISLKANLERFIADNPNNMINCPLCWGTRYPDSVPHYGVLDGNAIGAALLNAEKVIDF